MGRRGGEGAGQARERVGYCVNRLGEREGRWTAALRVPAGSSWRAIGSGRARNPGVSPRWLAVLR